MFPNWFDHLHHPISYARSGLCTQLQIFAITHEVPLRTLFNLTKLSLTVHCWRIYTVTAGSRTQLSDSQSPHCCRNLKQISCTRGVAFFCPAKLDKHCNYSFKFLVCGYFELVCGSFAVYETERVFAGARAFCIGNEILNLFDYLLLLRIPPSWFSISIIKVTVVLNE